VAASHLKKWTTVMTWKNFRKQSSITAVVYGTKEMEFDKILTLPLKTNARWKCVGASGRSRSSWRLAVGGYLSNPFRSLRKIPAYLQSVRAVISVGKKRFMCHRSGWFSCRSVCYLAAGFASVGAGTGFSEFFPAARVYLLFLIWTRPHAVQAVERAIETSKRRHRLAGKYLLRRGAGDLLTRMI